MDSASQPQQQNYGYGKTKMAIWQWLFIYAIVGVIVYALVYFFVFAKKGTYTNTGQPSQSTSSITPMVTKILPKLDSSLPTNNIYTVKKDSTKGSYLTDQAGIALYVFDDDTPGVSNCNGPCAEITWKPYASTTNVGQSLPKNISIITRRDGVKQFAWKGFPLYYFSGDTAPGQITGNGVNGFHLIN